MDYEIKKLNNPEDLQRLISFYFMPGLFEFTMTDGEKEIITQLAQKSLSTNSNGIIYAASKDRVIGAIGFTETKVKNGGYEITYWAVDPEFRGQGVGNKLFAEAEKYIKKAKGRFIIIETGDNEHTEASRMIYERKGYKQVGHIPFYYHKDEGMIIYCKSLE